MYLYIINTVLCIYMFIDIIFVGAVAVNGLIYVIGGVYCDSIECYDPESDTWTLSTHKLGSKDHLKTWAFSLNVETNINQDNIEYYYKQKN